jgi:hypothetical protein
MPGTARKTAPRKTADTPEPTSDATPEPTNAEPAPEQPNASPEPTNGASAPAVVDFMKLLETAEVDDKAAPKSADRKSIEVPEAWLTKVKETYESRKRVKLAPITTKVQFGEVGDLIRAAADRLDLSATVRAVYSPAPEGTEDKDRELCALTFTVGPRRKGPQSKKDKPVPATAADTSGDVPNADAPVSASGSSGE